MLRVYVLEYLMKSRLTPAMIGLLAVLIALTTVLTYLVRIPTPAKGYLNFSDVAITFTALAFGPWVGAIAGGVGTAIADLIGFPVYAPISLVVHGLQGLVIGLIGYRQRNPWMVILAWLAGAVVMVVGYLIGGIPIAGLPTSALDIPGNIIQALAGALLGIPLVYAVRKAYPAVDRLGQRKTWTE
jgi:uncharacterized membrane protein